MTQTFMKMQPLLWSFIAEETCCKKILKIKIMTDVRLINLIQSG